MFASAAAAPAGEAEAMQGLQLGPTTPDAAGQAGTAPHVDAGAMFTAAEQVAAGIMMGGATPTGAAQGTADMVVD
jgi:hypothetical protein